MLNRGDRILVAPQDRDGDCQTRICVAVRARGIGVGAEEIIQPVGDIARAVALRQRPLQNRDIFRQRALLLRDQRFEQHLRRHGIGDGQRHQDFANPLRPDHPGRGRWRSRQSERRIDQHEPARPIRISHREFGRGAGAEGVTDDDRGRSLQRIQHVIDPGGLVVPRITAGTVRESKRREIEGDHMKACRGQHVAGMPP